MPQINRPIRKTAPKQVRTFNKKAKRVLVDYEQSAVRMAAREQVKASPIPVEKNWQFGVVSILMAKRKYYELDGRALLKDARAALRKAKGQKAKIESARDEMYALIKEYRWNSMDEVKLKARSVPGLFDAKIVDGQIVMGQK